MSSHLRWACVAWLFSTALVMAQNFPPLDQLPRQPDPPQPLKTFAGDVISTPDAWWSTRRPELKNFIQHYMYGFAPSEATTVAGEVVRVDDNALGGKARLEEITLRFGPDQRGRINLLLVLPKEANKPVPLFVGLNFNGNHAAIADPNIALPTAWFSNKKDWVQDNHTTEAVRGKDADSWSADLLVQRGYGLATAYYGDIDPDKPDFTDGVHALYYRPGQTEPAPHEWGSVAAWAWGVSRMIDYVVTRKEINPARIATLGHSRLGKTALLAGALDERIAIVCPHQSGTGGMAMSRNNDQETVERINRVFPHWFNGNFKHFSANEEQIPFDQHCLVALCAPRPVFDTEGEQDKWANYDNSLRSLQGADPVYKLLGKRGLATGSFITDDSFKPENLSELTQYRRDAKHAMTREYWQRVLDFADDWYAQSK